MRWWASAYFKYKPAPKTIRASEVFSDKMIHDLQNPRNLFPPMSTVPPPNSGMAAIAEMVKNAPGGIIKG